MRCMAAPCRAQSPHHVPDRHSTCIRCVKDLTSLLFDGQRQLVVAMIPWQAVPLRLTQFDELSITQRLIEFRPKQVLIHDHLQFPLKENLRRRPSR